ncbi:N-methylhydantoinase B [Anaerosolibacter carboniphilus]|uniref:N-methylhydantoinase B n=1 Tax=Anaerosolibacter carboniphilus TaxID=1417629 RepID=A0A841L132_9FIRM|nr:hydantoinase B/oxoprolinase family protein [Anaerosolibacter carboniphilus]MBB6216089.1 N-methylhydantoinase B [Anaerosolibacter carboniphilus]
MHVDQIILQSVIAHRLDTIAQEMGIALERSSRSPIFAEACDFSCGVCNQKGELVSQLNGIPILAAAGSFSVQAVLAKYGDNIKEGDIFIVNDPYWGGNHLPDIGIITPVFYQGELVFFTVSRAHHGDIGGAVAGSYNTGATEIFQEGIRIPPTKVASQNIIIDEVLNLITYNTRNPEMLRSDLFAQIGANKIGHDRLRALLGKYGLEKVKESVGQLLQKAEDLTRIEISKFPPGTYVGEEWLDDDGFQQEPVKIKVAVTFKNNEVIIDFTESDKQVTGFVNSALVTTTSAAYIALLWTLSPEIPRNSGAFRPVKVIAPTGTVVNPAEPAPVTLSTLHCASEIISAILKACGKIVPERIPAGFGRYCGPSFYGVDPRNEKFYVGFAFCCLGSGGGMKGRDGLPYMAPISNYGGVRAPNNEANEVQYPLLTLRHHLEIDTAGAGKYRGAPGVKYQVEFYGPDPSIVMFGDGMKIGPYGLEGGEEGSLNKNQLVTKKKGSECLKSKTPPLSLQPGDTLTLFSSGGGGWGNPYERDPQLVYEDYKNGYISKENALKAYGVVLTDKGVQWSETEKIRGLGDLS